MNLQQHVFAVTDKAKIEFFRIAVPFEQKFIRRRIRVEHSRQYVQKFRQGEFVRRVGRRRVKFIQLYEDRETDEFEFNWRQPFPHEEFEKFRHKWRSYGK